MTFWGKEILGVVHAVTLFHYTERYRYTTTVTTYKVRSYMVVNRANPVYHGTIYRTAEDAEQGKKELQAWLRSILRDRDAELLIVVPYDTEETVTKRRAYRLG